MTKKLCWFCGKRPVSNEVYGLCTECEELCNEPVTVPPTTKQEKFLYVLKMCAGEYAGAEGAHSEKLDAVIDAFEFLRGTDHKPVEVLRGAKHDKVKPLILKNYQNSPT